jgi:hypothetical protein
LVFENYKLTYCNDAQINDGEDHDKNFDPQLFRAAAAESFLLTQLLKYKLTNCNDAGAESFLLTQKI